MSGPSEQIIISSNNIVQLAQTSKFSTPVTCNWAQGHLPCSISLTPISQLSVQPCQLYSWEALRLHLARHCEQDQQNGKKHCKCGAPFPLQNTLLHIRNAHMRDILLSCPFEGCNAISFQHEYHLVEHFNIHHLSPNADNLQQVPPSVLQPASLPHRPRAALLLTLVATMNRNPLEVSLSALISHRHVQIPDSIVLPGQLPLSAVAFSLPCSTDQPNSSSCLSARPIPSSPSLSSRILRSHQIGSSHLASHGQMLSSSSIKKANHQYQHPPFQSASQLYSNRHLTPQSSNASSPPSSSASSSSSGKPLPSGFHFTNLPRRKTPTPDSPMLSSDNIYQTITNTDLSVPQPILGLDTETVTRLMSSGRPAKTAGLFWDQFAQMVDHSNLPEPTPVVAPLEDSRAKRPGPGRCTDTPEEEVPFPVISDDFDDDDYMQDDEEMDIDE